MATTDSSDDKAADWIYRMEVAHTLPLIDLEKTPIAALVSKPYQLKFMDLMKRMYARFGAMYRFSGVLMIVILLVPRSVGLWLTFPTVLLAMPSTCLGVLMNSSDVLRILPRQYEFWFFTVMNTINWCCLASFYSDIRVLSLYGGIIGTQLVILIDSNFRTVTSSIRSTRVAAPVLLVFGVATFFRVLDTDDGNYRVIPVAKVTISLVDVFANTSLTLAIFVARKGYAKSKVLITHSASLQTIRCVVFRSKLQLKKPSTETAGACSLQTETRTFMVRRASLNESPRVLKTLSSFSPTRQPTVKNAIAMTESIAKESNDITPCIASIDTSPRIQSDTQQQVSLVSMKLSAIDARQTLVPHLSPLRAPLSPIKWIFFHANAVIGFLASVFTITRRPAGSEFPPTALEYSFALISLLSTLVFFITCVVSFHRGLIKSLLHNFDFLFSSVQFTMAIFLICDMVQWDFRTLGALAWLLWFHSVLTLDALTPPVKKNLGFRKIFLLPVIFASLTGIMFILYGFFFSDVADFFRERTIMEFHFHNKTVSMRTKSLLMNRLFTVLLWSFRLIWEVAGCPDDELIFIRGNLDYYTPMEMIPPLRPAPTVKPVANAATPMRRWWMRSRRAVYASSAAN